MQSVYIVASEGGPVKIGVASNPGRRVSQLRTTTPFAIYLAHVQEVDGLSAIGVERKAHALLKDAHLHGEWFSVTVELARQAIEMAIQTIRFPLPVDPTLDSRTASRRGTAAITVHYPEPVRRQLKVLASEEGRNVDDMVAEALNLLFARYRKPEIAPRRRIH